MIKKTKPPKSKISAAMPLNIELSELVKSIENLFSPYQSSINIGIEKRNGVAFTVTFGIKIQL